MFLRSASTVAVNQALLKKSATHLCVCWSCHPHTPDSVWDSDAELARAGSVSASGCVALRWTSVSSKVLVGLCLTVSWQWWGTLSWQTAVTGPTPDSSAAAGTVDGSSWHTSLNRGGRQSLTDSLLEVRRWLNRGCSVIEWKPEFLLQYSSLVLVSRPLLRVLFTGSVVSLGFSLRPVATTL